MTGACHGLQPASIVRLCAWETETGDELRMWRNKPWPVQKRKDRTMVGGVSLLHGVHARGEEKRKLLVGRS